MAIKDVIAAIRKEANITQEEMARRLYVTRQAVSRWEQGETTPGIDMVKLICVTFGVPLERFFDMPMSYYCQCCSMPIPDEEMHGTEADGSKSADFCKYCYDHGDFTAKGMSMDEFIEATAPMEAKALGVSLDEAVSLMATLLPHLKRWREVAENEEAYGAEVRAAYGDEVVDVANEKYVAMGEAAHLQPRSWRWRSTSSCDVRWRRGIRLVRRRTSSWRCTATGCACTGRTASTRPRHTRAWPTATSPTSGSAPTTRRWPRVPRSSCATRSTRARDMPRGRVLALIGRVPFLIRLSVLVLLYLANCKIFTFARTS